MARAQRGSERGQARIALPHRVGAGVPREGERPRSDGLLETVAVHDESRVGSLRGGPVAILHDEGE